MRLKSNGAIFLWSKDVPVSFCLPVMLPFSSSGWDFFNFPTEKLKNSCVSSCVTSLVLSVDLWRWSALCHPGTLQLGRVPKSES